MALNTTLVKSTAVAALGGLLFGFDTAVIAGATGALTTAFQLTPSGLGLTVSIALWGTVVGALLASVPGDRYGRRDSLRVMAIFYLVSALGCAFATNWYALIFSRFLGGLAIGGSSVLGPMYISEIAPARWRGRLVGLFQFNVVAGILLAYLSNYLVGLALQGSAMEWRWKLGISALPAALFFVMLFGIPRSPRWLARKGRIAEARSVLESIGEENIDSELRAMNEAFELEKREGQERLFTARNRLPLFLAFSIAIFNQFSGINAILYYLNDIFARAGFSKVSSDLQAVAIGGTNLLFTMLAMSIIDRVGRTHSSFGRCCGHRHLPRGRGCYLLDGETRSFAGLVADRVHRLFRLFARRRYLGLSQRNLPHGRARARPEPGQFHALDHERTDLLDVSRYRHLLKGRPLRALFRDDGPAVLRGPVLLSRNQEHRARGYGEEADRGVTLWI